VKIALHSKEWTHNQQKVLLISVLSVWRVYAHRHRDCSQVVSARTAKLTQELLMTERPVLQTSAHPGKRSSKTELAQLAQTSPEPSPEEESVPPKSVPRDRFFKLMVDVLTATPTPELHQMERLACHTTATTDRSLDQMVPVSIAQTTRELKELVSPVELTDATSDSMFRRTVPANTAHSSNQSAKQEDAAADQLASQASSAFQRTVSASSASSIS